MKYLIGLDVGTTGTKAMLFSETGENLGHAYSSYALSTPKIGRCEQDPLDWWNAIIHTIRSLCPDPEISENVAAISLSTQGGTLVAVDEKFNPVRPAIVWSDKRCPEQKRQFEEEFGSLDSVYQKTGWRLGNGLNLSQIRWLKENEPENFKKAAFFLSVPDYVSGKMTGIPACDMSNAGINHLVDIREGRYDPDLLKFAGIAEDRLPKLVHSGDVIGPLTKEAAFILGLTTKCVLVAGAHDQYAVAVGAGANKAGDILIGTGTAWVITAIGDSPDFDSGRAQSVAAAPGKWGTMWTLSNGGICLEWWRKKLTCSENEKRISFESINEEVAKRKAAEEGLFFFPFSGRSTLQATLPKGAFIGIDLAHDRFDLARAIMEGIAFQIVWMLGGFKTKPSKDGLKLSGGATKSPVWCQMIADISNLPVRIPDVADLACVGAAILAGVGANIFFDVEEGYRCLAVSDRVIYPDAETAASYEKLAREYTKIASELGNIYKV
ncbi:MAG: hypothetical protein MJ063_06370 [Lachnospiraceae bacterium]|nr:hypothetical protein [Lachnospiraceae bacterium]